MKVCIVAIVALSCIIPTISAATCTTPPASLIPTGGSYVANAGCTNGTTYNTATMRCHCWSTNQMKCGYICGPQAAATTAASATTTTAAATTTKAATTAAATTAQACSTPQASLIPTGGSYVANAGCTKGNTYNTATMQCHCWSGNQMKCGYICGPVATATTAASATTTTAAATTTKAATTAAATTAQACSTPQASLIPTGGSYVANAGCTKGNTYNTATMQCHCWSGNQMKCGYICGPVATATTAASATTTTAAATTTKAATTAAATTTTAAATTAKACGTPQPSLIPTGGSYVANAGCTNGPTYNTATMQCHCWSGNQMKCGYICGPAATTTTAPPG